MFGPDSCPSLHLNADGYRRQGPVTEAEISCEAEPGSSDFQRSNGAADPYSGGIRTAQAELAARSRDDRT